ncbi:MAG: cyclic nucleotide-binding domain-containing protein [Deltaproteobacteria bacterium]|nr:cyclic nucleotide-binding domain-containing protein [Deltaproteobacteria bacterium]
MKLQTRKDDTRRRRAVARALLVLRRAMRERAETAGDRIRVARAYRILGDTAHAAGWYRSAVDELSQHGDAVKALALVKEMAEVMPQEQRAFADLADRFSSGARDSSMRVAVPIFGVAHPLATEEAPPQRVLDASELLKVYEAETLGASTDAPLSGSLPSLVPPDVLEELHQRGEIDLYDPAGQLVARHQEDEPVEIGEEDIEILEDPSSGEAINPEEVIDQLEQVPLFSELDRDAFMELSRAVKLRTVGNHCLVFREGEQAESFFLVAEGRIEVMRRLRKKEIVLRSFDAGEPFGLFGLFAGKKRAANARAIGNASVLEIPAGALANVIRTHPKARVALSRFFRKRLLENFLASSPIFEDLDGVARGLLIAQFRQKHLKPGEPVVSPGVVFNGLFLVIAGQLVITKRIAGAREEELASLDRGQFFGIVSALSGNPCRCSVTALEDSTLTFLPQRAFNDFVKDYPALRELPRRLAAEGMLVDKDVFVGDAGIPGLS